VAMASVIDDLMCFLSMAFLGPKACTAHLPFGCVNSPRALHVGRPCAVYIDVKLINEFTKASSELNRGTCMTLDVHGPRPALGQEADLQRPVGEVCFAPQAVIPANPVTPPQVIFIALLHLGSFFQIPTSNLCLITPIRERSRRRPASSPRARRDADIFLKRPIEGCLRLVADLGRRFGDADRLVVEKARG
jgi:hypothetical protein